MKRFQELLMKDLGWKLLSVAIAATMWFMVISINQPIDTRTYSTTLILEGEETLTEEGLTIANRQTLEDTKVSVKVKAQRTSLDRLSQRQTELIEATLDLSTLRNAQSGDTITLPVNVTIAGGASGYTIENKTPSTLEIQVENLISREFPIQVMLSGESQSSGRLSEPTLSQDTIMVKGAQSAVNSVSAVRTFVDATEAVSQGQITATPVAYDAEGNTVQGVTFSEDSITVSYRMHGEKEVLIQVSTTGTPATDYHVANILCMPQKVTLTGTEEDLANINSITLDAIDVTGASETLHETVSLSHYLPSGVTAKSNSSVLVTVTFSKSEQTQLQIPSAQITMQHQQEGYTYTLPENIPILLQGENTANVTTSQISGTIDVSGLEAGEATATVVWQLPEGVTAADTSILVTVTAPPEQEEETPQEPEEPEIVTEE